MSLFQFPTGLIKIDRDLWIRSSRFSGAVVAQLPQMGLALVWQPIAIPDCLHPIFRYTVVNFWKKNMKIYENDLLARFDKFDEVEGASGCVNEAKACERSAWVLGLAIHPSRVSSETGLPCLAPLDSNAKEQAFPWFMQHVFCEMEAKQGQLRTKPTRTLSVSGPIASVLNKRFLNPSSRSCRGLQK